MSVNMADILRDTICDMLELDIPVTLSASEQSKLLDLVDELHELATPQAERIRLNEKYGVE